MVDLTLAARVRSALKDSKTTQEVNTTNEAQKGRVILKGIVVNSDEQADAEKIASLVPGVTGVENRLRLMTSSRIFICSKT
ncbi:BON domain-containing protein [Curvibacter fontanus]